MVERGRLVCDVALPCGWTRCINDAAQTVKTAQTFEPAHLHGTWKIIHHGQSINYTCAESIPVNFQPDGTITGRNTNGTWTLDADGFTLRVTIKNAAYTGRVLRCYNADCDRWVMAFTAMSAEGIALWGAGLAPTKPTAH